MQNASPFIHFKTDLCFLKLTRKSNLKVRESYSLGQFLRLREPGRSSSSSKISKNTLWGCTLNAGELSIANQESEKKEVGPRPLSARTRRNHQVSRHGLRLN